MYGIGNLFFYSIHSFIVFHCEAGALLLARRSLESSPNCLREQPALNGAVCGIDVHFPGKKRPVMSIQNIKQNPAPFQSFCNTDTGLFHTIQSARLRS
jgi:hypothetical protein